MLSQNSNPKLAYDIEPANNQQSHIIVVTRDELDRLGDILDDPFITLNEQQKALSEKGYRLVKI